jgi:hypothetical protein
LLANEPTRSTPAAQLAIQLAVEPRQKAVDEGSTVPKQLDAAGAKEEEIAVA